MASHAPVFGEQATDADSGRPVWWDGFGWAYKKPAGRLIEHLQPSRNSTGHSRFPLSLAQQRLWFIDRLEGPSPEYNMLSAQKLIGPLDRDALARAIDAIVRRHAILRTHFEDSDGDVAQVVASFPPVEIPMEDLSALSVEQREARINEAMEYESHEPFDLLAGPMFRIRLLKTAPQEHIFLRTMHHIVTDGWSVGVFNRELTLLYKTFSAGGQNPLAPLSVQYADFAVWQRRQLSEGRLDADVEFWKKHLAGAPPFLELPADRARPGVRTFEADMLESALTRVQSDNARKLADQHRATVYMTLLAAFGMLLWNYSGQDDIVVGSPIANRQEPQLEPLIGFFVNSLAVRLRIHPEERFAAFLAQVRQTAIEAYQHQDVPFAQLVEELAPERNPKWTPIFQVEFAFQNAPYASDRLEGLAIEPVRGYKPRVHCDLSLSIFEKNGQIVCTWIYNRHLFVGESIRRMAHNYVCLLDQIVLNPEQPIGRIELVGAVERHNILTELNGAVQPLTHVFVTQRFDRQAAWTPTATAVIHKDARISFQDLNERTNRLARFLIAARVGPECIVAVALPRSIDMIVVLLAILKTGAAYLPLDHSHPAQRLAFILNDARPVLVVTTREIAPVLPPAAPCFLLDDENITTGLNALPSSNIKDADRIRTFCPDNIAYVMYTSGSTGKPKGVVIPHSALASFLDAVVHAIPFRPGDRHFAATTIAFDVSIADLFLALCQGSTVVLAGTSDARTPRKLTESIRAERATSTQGTPAFWRLLLEEDSECLTGLDLYIGGEALTGDLAQRLCGAGARVWNLYGPTETTVYATGYFINGDDVAVSTGGVVSIGRPLANYRVYILNRTLQLVPIGAVGELYIAGPCLARGYLNRTGLTAERFVADPWGAPGTRMYRTGDLARRRSDGEIEYLGRLDHQVKIRGFRIELGEIEAAIREEEGIAESVVVTRKEANGEHQLIAYVVARPGGDFEERAVYRRLAAKLPGYMLPTVVKLDRLPTSPTGKLDRDALPPPSFGTEILLEDAGPRTPEELILTSLFEEVLGLDRIGIDDNFFELGGHSLLAVKLANRIRQEIAVDFTGGALFESPTVRELATRVTSQAAVAGNFERILPLRKTGSLPPLFCIPPAGGLGWSYARLSQHIHRDRPLYCLQARGIEQEAAFATTIEEMAADYIQVMRGVQRTGPYHLLGWCVGGTLAHAMACELQQQNEQVALLAILDGYPIPIRREGAVQEADGPGIDEFVGHGIGPLEASRIVKLIKHWQLIFPAFRAGTFQGAALVFAATAPPWKMSKESGQNLWQPHVAGDLEVYEVACAHARMTSRVPMASIATTLEDYLCRNALKSR